MTLTTHGNALRAQGLRGPLLGKVDLPGDKSISHRALMLGAIADGTTYIRNFLPANDCLATLGAMRALGIEIEVQYDGVLVHGKGLRGLQESYRPIECGGSGTTMRLLAGLLASQPFYSVLAGNAQLSKRPMERVATPLRALGATIQGRGGGKYAPLSIEGGHLRAIRYRPPVASAQVKSAVLLAGLFADGLTVVEESLPTRDHTERMLEAMGATLHIEQGAITLRPVERLAALDVEVPGDMSSAAFMLVAASIVPGSRVLLPGVGVNPGRTGVIATLLRMGGQIAMHNERIVNGEPVADLEVLGAPLKAIDVAPTDVPSLIDELPVLAVAATQAEGLTEVRGAGELRVKETDRIATTVEELRRMGAKIEALEDGFRVEGPTRLRGARVSSHGDHRLAMALAVAALVAAGETVVEDTECIGDSFPGFEKALAKLSAEESRL